MKIIKNPFTGNEGYHCFGCSPSNPAGLHMEFRDEGEYIVCDWEPNPAFQGYTNVLHGGIQATLMDEIASWTIYVKAETGGVTSRMETFYKKPVPTNKGKIRLKAKITEVKRRIITVEVTLYDSSGKVCSTAMVDYFTLPVQQAREKLDYPGKDAFIDE